MQKKAESLIEKYEFDYTKALKDVDYVNVNNVTGKGEVNNVSMLTLESLERCVWGRGVPKFSAKIIFMNLNSTKIFTF